MTRVVTSVSGSGTDVAAAIRPRRGVIAERPAPDGSVAGAAAGTFAFEQAEGPLARYRRTVTVGAANAAAQPGDPVAICQEVDFQVGLPYVSWLFVLPLRHHLGRILPPSRFPWWSPPACMDRRAARVLAVLCALSVLTGYLTDLFADTMTYAGSQFGVGSTGQGVALGVAQVSAVLALVLLARADRRGRRPLLVASLVAGALLTALGAATPSLTALTATQVLAGAASGAAAVLVAVVAIEEMPAGARAWAIGVISMSFGLGSGLALVALPLAGLGRSGWRWVYVLGLLVVPGVAHAARRLPESRRFTSAMGAATRPGLSSAGRRRLWIIGLGALLFALFFTPAGQLQNHYLRHERHLSALGISVLEQVAGTIGGLGTLVGGRLADTVGRRPVAVVGVACGVLVTIAGYLSGGVALWVWLTLGSVLSYAVGPALAVYGGELFPTGRRGRVGGILTVMAAAGGLIGLVAGGALTSAFGHTGPALAVLAVGPFALIVLIALAYPETAREGLEDLNPEDVQSAPAP